MLDSIPFGATDFYINHAGDKVYLLIKSTYPKHFQYIEKYGWLEIDDKHFKLIMRSFVLISIKES